MKKQNQTKEQMQRKKNQGMNWIWIRSRYAIYLRDGMACVYCGADATTKRMGLDHIVPVAAGGQNKADNLVTCCETCNSRKNTKPMRQWLKEIKDNGSIRKYIDAAIVKEIKPYRKEAKLLLARRKAAKDAAKAAKSHLKIA